MPIKSINTLQREFYGHQRSIASQRSQTFTQTGKVAVTIPVGFTTAEATVTVTFVNTLIEEPCFTCGAVLDPGQVLTAGSYPTSSAIVYSWNTIDPPDAIPGADPSLFAYTGANVGIVVSGVAGMVVWVHYSFVGIGLSFPAPVSPANTTGNA